MCISNSTPSSLYVQKNYFICVYQKIVFIHPASDSVDAAYFMDSANSVPDSFSNEILVTFTNSIETKNILKKGY